MNSSGAPDPATTAALAEVLHRQRQILENLQESVITLDLEGYITGWNQGAEELFGYSAAEAVGRNVLFLYADDAALDEENDDPPMPGRREFDVRRRRKNGEIFWAGMQLALLRDERGEPSGLIGYLRDVTRRREAEESLRMHARIFDLADEAIIVTDAAYRIIAVNPATSRISGFTGDEMLGRSQAMFRCEHYDDAFYKDLLAQVEDTGRWQGELWTRRKDGEIYPAWVSTAAVRNRRGVVTHYFSVCADITERKRTEGRIQHLAFYDALTTLPNRVHFHRLLDQALTEAKRKGRGGALLFIDLNRFKPINDTLGHGVGDQVLQEVAARLRNSLRGADVVARLGGDEFVIGLFDIAQPDHVSLVAHKILQALSPPVLVGAHELSVGGAIGISVFPDNGADADTLLRLADIAMYRAKETGPDAFEFYTPEMNERATERLAIEAGLRRAITRGELLLVYQPKVSLITGQIIGAEALVRWKHPERGMVPPVEFIPLAEETGLIVQISHWVLEEACAQARRWQDAGLAPLRIAVNLSARDFSPALPERVTSLLSAQGIGSEWLELEITEGMLMNRTDAVIAMMEDITKTGVTLSLDDFGTGYSSLSYLKRFPIHTLKIDRSFVINIPGDSDDCAIAGAIAGMGSQLGHSVIAEGVESLDQVEFLRRHGCDEIQGYLFSPPVSPDKFEAMVRAGKRLQ